jgi:Rrp15p
LTQLKKQYRLLASSYLVLPSPGTADSFGHELSNISTSQRKRTHRGVRRKFLAHEVSRYSYSTDRNNEKGHFIITMAKRKKSKTPKSKVPIEVKEEELDRFAGSSESEQELESELDHDDEKGESTTHIKPSKHAPTKEDHPQNKGNDNNNDTDDDDDDDDDVAQYERDSDGPTGLASAMSKILGTRIQQGTPSVILSKTTTPLQRMAKVEQEKAKEAKEKRRVNREKKLEALHVPLSVATTTHTLGSAGLVKELELERAHRRVATRGVVALFNAIAQHQKKNEGTVSVMAKSANKSEVKNLTKHGFLDMIKTAATEKCRKADEAYSHKETTEKPKWNALKDNFMMGSKLKDWDKESSDDEEEDETIHDNFDDDPVVEAPTKKRQKVL